jgi:hypothetical protein
VAPGLDFSIGIDVNGDSTEDCATRSAEPRTCHVAPDGVFTVRAYLDHLPNSVTEYAGIGVQLYFMGVEPKGTPSLAPWPACAFAASAHGFNWVNGGCAVGLDLVSSNYTGLVATSQFRCIEDGSVSLGHRLGETSIVTDALLDYYEAGPDKLVIDCGRPAPPAGTPTATPTPPAAVQGDARGPSMALQVYSDNAKQQLVCERGVMARSCEVGARSEFSVDVHTDAGPPNGYQGYQVVIQYSGNLSLVQQDGLAENRWPRCAGRGVEQMTAPMASAPGRYVLGCTSTLPARTYEGVLANVHFACKGTGSGLISIVGGGGAYVSFYHKPSINGDRIFLAGDPEGGQQLADAVIVHCGSDGASVSGADTDGDRCADAREAGANERAGGRRDALNPWDFFDPTGDGKHRIDDVLRVVDSYFADEGDVNYSMEVDRTLLGPNAWNLGPPNGQVRIDDVVNMVKQYFHDCS